ncbi:MAG: hypothetical protein U5Q03_00935 [Bacteroidota bacterium]|nr:hypothetical protein [Bacteroidota bacterium]
MIGIILAIVVAFGLNYLSLYPGAGSALVLIEENYAGFWKSIPHLDTKYHIVGPFEGLVLITVLYFYFCIGLNKIHNSKQRQIEQGFDKR